MKMLSIKKSYANKGVERNKKPLSNIVYIIKFSQEGNEECKFKDLGYLYLEYFYQKHPNQKYHHGKISIEKLKSLIGDKQYQKFCQGKREFIIQRRENNGNISKK